MTRYLVWFTSTAATRVEVEADESWSGNVDDPDFQEYLVSEACKGLDASLCWSCTRKLEHGDWEPDYDSIEEIEEDA